MDPEKLSALNLTAYDVVNAVRSENMQFAAGHFGQPPTSGNTLFEFPITTIGRLTDPADFEEIVLRSDKDGRKVRIKDIGSAVLGARNQDTTSKVNGWPNGSIAIFALPDANSIDTADRVKAKMNELKKNFPKDLDYVVSLDMTPFIQESIWEVFRTLVEAVILVALVVLVFLQNWRSAIIPLVAVPVAIVGTFAVMAAIGFTLNNLTLFGLVLAIGIVVDDAIVVVEAVEHHIEEGMTPCNAAHQAMNEVSGPVVAVALVLSAVFVPCAFITGITGQFFKQFALTIAVSTVISAFNSLTLSPALAAILLQPSGAKKDWFGRLLDFVFGWFFWLFNEAFQHIKAAYLWVVGASLCRSAPVSVLLLGVVGGFLGWELPMIGVWLERLGLPAWINSELRIIVGLAAGLIVGGLIYRGLDRLAGSYRRFLSLRMAGSAVVLLAYGGLLADTLYGFRQLPTGYIPNQDQGRFYIALQLPDATSVEQTQKAVDHIRRLVQDVPGVLHTTAITGQSFTFNANGSNFGQFFISFKGFEERRKLGRENGMDMSSTAIVARVQEMLDTQVPEAKASLFTPPPVSGLGSASGFKIIIEDRGDLGIVELQKEVERVMAAGNGGHYMLTEQSLAGLRAEKEPPPEPVMAALAKLQDRDYLTRDLFIGALGETMSEADLQDKALRDQVQRLALARAENRKVVSHLFSVFRANVPQLFVDLNREQCQTMGVNPRDVFSTLQIYLGSFYINDFNEFGRTWQVNAQAAGQFRTDPSKIKLLKVRNAAGDMVPLGAVLNVREVGGPINIGRYNMYPAAAILGSTEPGISSGQGIEEMERICGEVLSPGMDFEWTEINYMEVDAAKNIIVEFAKHKRESGLSRQEATLQACRLRLRPILMTSFAFILGVVPLLVSTGAGFEMRRKLGTAVFSGMLGVTLFGIFLTPVFFNVIEWMIDTWQAESKHGLFAGLWHLPRRALNAVRFHSPGAN